ncbi:MAG TPA: response regulator transcription factor [Steroidobacteraceae bacterium]|nr:response regulator transcription factor [Steroidobacteraceae bacterium]
MNAPEAEAAAPRVLIADDHPLYCDALRAVVPQACPGADIRDAASQEEVLAAVNDAHALDLVLLDLNLPGAVGLSCLRALRQIAPRTPIVVVSAVGDPKVMQDAIMAGASAFIPKSAPGQVLINALKVIIAGGTYMPAEVLCALRNADHSFVDELTSRQRRVLELLSTGLSNKRIARELNISEITVKAHVSAIFRKLGVTNRMQAGLEARRLLDQNY